LPESRKFAIVAEVVPTAGDRVPDFSVFRAFKDPVESAELFADGPTLVHFYVFDFTGSPEGG
jgi:hypothetical protein